MAQDSSRLVDLEPLVQGLEEAMRVPEIPVRTARVKTHLESLAAAGTLRLPEEYVRPGGDGYARRLLHRADGAAYTVVVMAWGPGQRTTLHDHAGIWCVECVMDGELEVVQFDLIERDDALFRFERKTAIRAGVGQAGCLIPPYEYHVLGNALEDRTSVSLHVYGGEMESCNLFHPESDGWWRRTPKQLSYDS